MRVSGQRIIVFGDSLAKHPPDSSPEIWDVNQGSNRASSSPGDLLASMLAEQGAEAVRVNARVSRSAWNFFQRENSAQLLAADAHFRPTHVVIMLGTNDVGLNQIQDREAFTKLRDSYLAMGAEVWAVGPFANTSKDPAGVDQVAKTMRGVFGRQFIDGREISLIVKPGRDGLHYDQIGARQLAMAISAALAGRMATNTIWATAGFSLLGVGLAVIAAMAYRRYGGKSLGLAALSRKDEKELQELIKQPGVEVLDVAQDRLLENGERVSTFAKTGGEIGPHSQSYFQLDLGRDKINWWIERKGMNRCSAHFRVFNDGIMISDGTEINASGGREPKAFIENYGTESAEYCERAAASTAWQIAKTLKRMPGMPHGQTDNLILIKNAQNDVREAINRDKDHDHSEPEELYGLGAKRKDPNQMTDEEFDVKMKLDELIRDPDPAVMDVAEDVVESSGFKLSRIARVTPTAGEFVLNPLKPADAPRTVVRWNLEPMVVDGKKKWRSRVEVYFHRKAGFSESDGGGVHIPPTYAFSPFESEPEFKTLEAAHKASAAVAWSIAKALKKLPARASSGEVYTAASRANNSMHKTTERSGVDPGDFETKLVWGPKKQLFGELAGPTEDAIDIALDMAEEGNHERADEILFQEASAVPTGNRQISQTIVAQCIRPIDMRVVDSDIDEIARDDGQVKQALYHIQSAGPEIGRVQGSTKFVQSHVIVSASARFATKRTPGETAIFPATPDATAVAEHAWPVPLFPSPDPSDDNPDEGFTPRADFRDMFSHIGALREMGVTHIVPCEGVELFGAKSLGKPQSMLKTIAAESQSADEFARRAEAWASAESKPPNDKAIAKLFKGASVAMIEQARQARQASTQARYKKLARGLRGVSVGETFKRNNSKTPYTVVEIVKPARTVGTLKIGETIKISHGDERIDITDAGGTWIDSQGRKYKRTK